MKNEVILTGKTVEEAMSEARRLYGTPENELSFEILEMPKKGFLGFGAAPAKIRVTITKALEDVNLSDLVSELKSMKLTTDRDPEQRPRENRENRENRGAAQNKKNNARPQAKPEQVRPEQAKSEQVRPEQVRPESAKPQSKPQAKPQATPVQPKVQPKPEQAKPVQAQPKSEQVRPEQVKSEQPKAETKAASQPKTLPMDESTLPAALRRPVAKNPAKEKPKAKKPAQAKPQDTRDEETKKKDLLSAVMGISAAAPAAPTAPATPAAPVAPTVEKVTPVVPVVPAVIPAAEEEKSLSDAVDAALAQALADTAAPEITETLESAPQSHDDEPRIEFVSEKEMELALSFVNTLLTNMQLNVTAQPSAAPEGVETPENMVYARVEIVGEDTGILIGHHGETLDSLQYLMNLSTIRKCGADKREFVKILLDVGNYREKREETLRTLARRTAARVVKYKRNFVLEPMNPYERRIIHSELHGFPDVSTHSVGSDENRKIVITYEGADKPKDNRRGGCGDRRRRGGERTDRAPERAGRPEKAEKAENGVDDRAKKTRGDRPQKPVRAKSIDEIQIDLSSDSNKTFGSILADEGVETDADPIEAIAREAEAGEENLREY